MVAATEQHFALPFAFGRLTLHDGFLSFPDICNAGALPASQISSSALEQALPSEQGHGQ
jgi:hypothetical protein